MEPKYTPMMTQYLKIKEKHPDTLILFRLGDFYELFFEDAKTASRELQLTLTGRNAGVEERVPMCGVPYHAIKNYIVKLNQRGYKVGIVEQLEDPATAKGLVERDVIQIITPGASMDLLTDDNNYITAVDETEFNYVISYSDLSTGELYVMNVEHDVQALLSELDNLCTREIVIVTNFNRDTLDTITSKRSILLSFENDNTVELEFESLMHNVTDIFQMKCISRLLHYLKATQKRQLDYFQEACVIKTNKTLQMDANSKLNLELTRTIRSEDKYGSLFWVLDDTKTAMGRRLLKTWINKPSCDIEEIMKRQNMITSFVANFMIREDIKQDLNQIYDLERLIARISFGNCNARDMLQLKNSLMAVPSLKERLTSLNNGYIDEIVAKMNSLEDLTGLLESAISEDCPLTIKEGGIFKIGYNTELDEIIDLAINGKSWVKDFESRERERTGIKTLKVGYNNNFGYYIEVTNSNKSLIQEEWGYVRKQTTVNGERYITQELKDKETLITNAEDRRMKLEYELFLKLREIVKASTSTIQLLANKIALVDVIVSLATTSAKSGYVCPTFNYNHEINIVEGKHPVIEKVLKNNNYVANDVFMNKETNILLITGPNMGGKSTYMRQLTLIVILAQMGCYVPATSCSLPVFDQIFTRIGASDDLVAGQSTFMVEMFETNHALRHATENSLIIFDEIGRGTATFDGMALAQAIIEYIATRLKCKTLFSTHYHELTTVEDKIPSLKNVHVCVSQNDDDITFLYKVQEGSMNQSYGVNVARLAHLPDVLLERAKEILISLENKEVVISKNVMAPVAQKEEAWIKDVKEVNPLNMTPLEALNFLYDLKKKM